METKITPAPSITQEQKALLDNGYLTTHEDPNHGNKEVYPITTKALPHVIDFITKQYAETKDLNIIPLIDKDENATPEFSGGMQETLRNAITEELKNGERRYYLIHRDGHTSALIKEKVCEKYYFTLVDSYNAHGVCDADHLPLLQIIRDNMPNAFIQTNNDKMQSDYYNCRTFAILSLCELGLALQQHQECSSVFDYIQQNNLGNFFRGDSRSESKTEYTKKENNYKKLKITTYGFPPALLQLAQSVSMIKTLAGNEYKKLDVPRTKNGETYKPNLEEHIHKTSGEKEINTTVNFFYKEILSHMYKLLQIKMNPSITPTPLTCKKEVSRVGITKPSPRQQLTIRC